MSTGAVVIEGTLRPDGTLELNQKVDLPAGRVHVTIAPVANQPEPEQFWTMMKGIWAAQQARGHVARAREEIDADINALREEADEEMEAVERLQEECRRAREDERPANEPPR
jgi:hypothetical protein